MIQIDLWTWKCLRCDWTVASERTVNNQQAVAEALIRAHCQSHDEQAAAAMNATSGDGGTTAAEFAGSGARGTLDGRTRDDESRIPNPTSLAASSADPLPSEREPQNYVLDQFAELVRRIEREPKYTVCHSGNDVSLLQTIQLWLSLNYERYQRLLKAEAALAAADPALRTLRWQSIESAPTDGTEFIGYFHNGEQHIVWLDEGGECHREMDEQPWSRPMMWHPMLAPPFANLQEKQAADLDRVCPEIRDEQKESPTDPV